MRLTGTLGVLSIPPCGQMGLVASRVARALTLMPVFHGRMALGWEGKEGKERKIGCPIFLAFPKVSPSPLYLSGPWHHRPP